MSSYICPATYFLLHLWRACNEEGDGFHFNKLVYPFAVSIYFVFISSYRFVFSFRSVISRKAALSDVVDTMFSKKSLIYLVFRQLEIRDAVIGNRTAKLKKCEG